MARFSKDAMIEELERRVKHLAEVYNFDPGNGTAQLKARDIEAAVAYGKWHAFRMLIQDIEGGHIAK